LSIVFFTGNDEIKEVEMNSLATWIVPVSIGAVAVVLVLGLANMLRGGDGNTSQKLMRLRVVLQFIAIVIIMGVIWLKGG
jgi:hypothetical protein